MKRIIVCALSVIGLVGCADHRSSQKAGQIATLEVQLVDPPADKLGSPQAPVTAKSATFNVIARDDQGAVVPKDLDVQVFISFGGVKTGANSACGADDTGNKPIETLSLKGGVLMNQKVDLPLAFGSTSLWIDDPASGTTGASPTIYFRNAFIPEVQTPPDVTAANATFCSPFNGKFLVVTNATGSGQLVVSSVFGNAFSITDTGATTFNSIYLFAFGKPPSYIVEGRVVNSFSGNYSKFVGFTELNFPLFDIDMNAPLVAPPAPVPLAFADLTNVPKMLGSTASTVSYTGTICNPFPPNPTNDANIQKTRDSWTKFNQFVVDNNGQCDAFANLAVELPAKVLGPFDPLQVVGKQATFVGMLRNNSGQNPYLDTNGNSVSCTTQMPCTKGTCIDGTCYKNAFNFWTITPRRQDDITVAP
ncbi:MAG: hypothetical protein JWN44_5259 [Myxococcales bacterium]|nr:hypothetical protein [Myxococcales bacterium]